MKIFEKLKEDWQVGGKIGVQIYGIQEMLANRRFSRDVSRLVELRVKRFRTIDIAAGLPDLDAIKIPSEIPVQEVKAMVRERNSRLLVRQIAETLSECGEMIAHARKS